MTERGQEDFDRDFTAMVSGLEMDPEGTLDEPAASAEVAEPPDFRRPHPTDAPSGDFNLERALSQASPDEPDRSEYTPPPLPPLRPPRGPAAVGWLCFAYALAVLMLTIVGVRIPVWAGWAAIVAFVAAIVLGWRSLPRDRDPGSGDGAVV
jgi:hypothetical protein